jgi:hypothetical protein
VVPTSNDSQEWKGGFRSGLVLQTFAVHLSSIEGSVEVPDLCDKPLPYPIGALGLAAASVCAFYSTQRIFLIIDRLSGHSS